MLMPRFIYHKARDLDLRWYKHRNASNMERFDINSMFDSSVCCTTGKLSNRISGRLLVIRPIYRHGCLERHLEAR